MVKKRLILASASPRRSEILTELGFAHRLQSVEADETIKLKSSNLEDVLKASIQISRQKMQAFLQKYESTLDLDEVVLAADTIVHFEGQILGKPENQHQARQTLETLSEKTHDVVTGWVFYSAQDKKIYESCDHTQVSLKMMSVDQIKAYIAEGLCFDRAGSYGIQDESFDYIENIQGSFSNVVGLSKEGILKQVKQLNWSFS